MTSEYFSIGTEGYGEIEEKKSRFLASAVCVITEEDARARIEAQRKKYYEAKHCCYAWILGEDGMQKRFSDDGEPSGTAGAPILKVLEGAGVTNSLIMVTRYFGGTLLGTGGLVRAYTDAAAAALRNAQIVRWCECGKLSFSFDYTYLDRIRYLLEQAGSTMSMKMGEIQYGEKVTIPLTVRSCDVQEIRRRLTDLTGGRIIFSETVTEFEAL